MCVDLTFAQRVLDKAPLKDQAGPQGKQNIENVQQFASGVSGGSRKSDTGPGGVESRQAGIDTREQGPLALGANSLLVGTPNVAPIPKIDRPLLPPPAQGTARRVRRPLTRSARLRGTSQLTIPRRRRREPAFPKPAVGGTGLGGRRGLQIGI